MTKIFRKISASALSALFFFACAAGVHAFTTEEECDFAENLATNWRMGDYALKALDALEAKSPADKAAILPSRVSVLAAMGKLSNAVALVESMPKGPDADDARIAIARVYFREGKPAEAKAIFIEYFKAHPEPPTDAARVKRYRGICSQFGAMMKAAGDELAAIEAGRRYLKTKPEEELADAIRCDLIVLLMSAANKVDDKEKKAALLKEANTMCDMVLKHGINIFWGQALVGKANILLLQGDRAGALKLIKEQSDVLLPLDDFLRGENRLAESPRAGMLMMNAKISEEDAKAAKAKKDEKTALAKYIESFKAYWTVFLQYGESDYGLPAGSKANEIKAIIEAAPYNKSVNLHLTREQEDRIIGYQFKLADQKKSAKEYDKAIPEYLKVLSEYPEADRSVRALGSMLQCYAEGGDKLMVKATASYIGERFHSRAFAAPLISALIKFYYDKKDEGMFFFVCNTYIDSFPADANASQVLYFMASTRLATSDYISAEPILKRIVDNPAYKNDRAYGQAIGQIGQIQLMNSNYVDAAASFKAYADSMLPSIEKYVVMSKYADSLRLAGQYADAIPVYEKLVATISDPSAQLLTSPMKDVNEKAKDTLERCAFNVAVCFSRIPDNVDANRAKATAAYDDFLKKFPTSTNYAPRAMAGRGQVFLAMDKFDEASKVFQELASKYPNSAEGKSALVSLVQSALEIKRLDQAKKAFSDMMQSKVAVRPEQYVQMGQVWLDNGIFEEAALTYQQVIGKTTDRNLEQPALFGYGKAQFQNKKYKESADALAELLKKYARTPYYFEARLVQSGALRELGQYKEALDALSDIFIQPSATPDQKMQAQYEILLLQEREGKKAEALGSALRNVGLAVLGNQSNPAILGWIEKITVAGMRVGAGLEKWNDVVELADGYTQLLPTGKQTELVRKLRSEAVSKGGAAK